VLSESSDHVKRWFLRERDLDALREHIQTTRSTSASKRNRVEGGADREICPQLSTDADDCLTLTIVPTSTIALTIALMIALEKSSDLRTRSA
jgi:hypothetical protein